MSMAGTCLDSIAVSAFSKSTGEDPLSIMTVGVGECDTGVGDVTGER